MEAPEDEIGIAGTISDTTDNGASMDEVVNMHRTGSYDWDARWSVDTSTIDEDTCTAAGNTVNKTVNSVYHEGKSALAMFNTNRLVQS